MRTHHDACEVVACDSEPSDGPQRHGLHFGARVRELAESGDVVQEEQRSGLGDGVHPVVNVYLPLGDVENECSHRHVPAGERPWEPRIDVGLVGRILDTLRVHGVSALAGSVGDPLDTHPEFGKPSVGRRTDGVCHCIEVTEAESVDEGPAVASVVLHDVSEGHTKRDRVHPQFVGEADENQGLIGFVDSEIR